MSLVDRLRIRFTAGPTDTTRTYGAGNYGDDDYGWIVPEWTDFECRVSSVDLAIGRDRLTDLAPAGTLTVRAHTERPRVVAAIGETPAGLAGRLMVLEVLDGVDWWPAFTGTVENAAVELVGTGVEGGELTLWTFTALDAIAHLSVDQRPDGSFARSAENAYTRCAALCALASLTVADACGSFANGDATDLVRDLKTEAELPLEPTARLTAARDSFGIEVVPWRTERTAFPDAAGGDVLRWLVSSTADRSDVEGGFDLTGATWLVLPAPVRAVVGWPVTRTINAATVTRAADGAGWEILETESILSFGRRSFVRSFEIDATTASAINTYGQALRSEYGWPVGRLTTLRFAFGHDLDLDTTLPDPEELPATDVGFARTLAALAVGERFDVRLPPDDTGIVWGAQGIALGYTWEITPDLAFLDVLLDCQVFAVTDAPAETAFSFATGATLTVDIPDTVDPNDVEALIDIEWGQQTTGTSAFDSTEGVSGGAILSWKLDGVNRYNMTALEGVSGINSHYNTSAIGTDRFVAVFTVDGVTVGAEYQHPSGGSTTATMPSEFAASKLFLAGRTMRLGGTSFDGLVYRFRLRQLSTGNVLVDLRPADFDADGWNDPLGNAVTVTGTITVV